jgi:hypothetical protein
MPLAFFFGNGRWLIFCAGSGTKQAQPRMRGLKGSALILPAAFADINIAKG